MPDLITVLVGIVSLVLGWGLTTIASAWTWRRQQVLDAYLEFLAVADSYTLQVGKLWSSGKVWAERKQEWIDDAEEVRRDLVAVDRAYGKLVLVAGWGGTLAAFDLYIGCEVMYRRALAVPPTTPDHFRAATDDTVKAYYEVVDQGRKEMWMKHWRERLPGRESQYKKISRRMAELNSTDPYPGSQNPETPPSDSKS